MNLRLKTLDALLLTFGALLLSCQKEDEDIGLSLSQNSQFQTYFTDTVTVQTSTVLLDSKVATSGTAYLLAGRYVDERLGTVTGKSFFQMGTAGVSGTIGQEAVLDSLVLSLDYAYSYGDTTRLLHLNVHQLSGKMVSGTTYYNTDQIAYEATALASAAFSPRPGRRRPLRIRMPAALGSQLLEQMKLGTLNSTDFLNTFRGLALVPDTADNGALLGFRAASDSTGLKLYYHQRSEQQRENQSVSFSLSDQTLRSNYLQSDRSGSLLASLQHTYEGVGIAQTNEEAFVQSGTGLCTRIDFPYLYRFKALGTLALNSASLIVRPVSQSQQVNHPAPASLLLYETDNRNRPLNLLSATYTDLTGTAYLVQDGTNNLRYYQFGLNSYVTALMRSNVASDNGLLLTIPATSGQLTINRLVLGGSKHAQSPIKLELVYTQVK